MELGKTPRSSNSLHMGADCRRDHERSHFMDSIQVHMDGEVPKSMYRPFTVIRKELFPKHIQNEQNSMDSKPKHQPFKVIRKNPCFIKLKLSHRAVELLFGDKRFQLAVTEFSYKQPNLPFALWRWRHYILKDGQLPSEILAILLPDDASSGGIHSMYFSFWYYMYLISSPPKGKVHVILKRF
jgi:hypothetical protein